MTNTPSHLASLTAAEHGLVAAISATTSSINDIATHNLDVALARLELAARACHARLGIAMATLRRTVGEIVSTMESMAGGIFEELNTPAPVPSASGQERALAYATLDREQQLHAEPVTEASVTPSEEMFDLRAGEPAPVPHAQEGTQLPRQDAIASETTRGSSGGEIETTRVIPAAGQTVHVAAIAANAPVDGQHRDVRRPLPSAPTTTPKKPRRRRAG
jgi:hypothetical protein